MNNQKIQETARNVIDNGFYLWLGTGNHLDVLANEVVNKNGAKIGRMDIDNPTQQRRRGKRSGA